jgi:uncharacterized membrane protein (UPF0127 family)
MDMKRPKSLNTFFPFLILLLVVIVVAIALAVGGSEPKPKAAPKPVAKTAGCGSYRKDGVVTANGHQLNVETAAGSRELTKGLSGRPCLPPDWGMLFDFARDGQWPIWMKEMKFPIDVAWINSAHKVVALEIDFKPSTYPEQRANQAPARYVLEINANKSKLLDMDLGTEIHFQKP